MFIKAGDTLINSDNLRLLSLDFVILEEQLRMELHAYVEGIEEPLTLAVGIVSDPDYSTQLKKLKYYIKAVHLGLEEGWRTYEFGQSVSGLRPDAD